MSYLTSFLSKLTDVFSKKTSSNIGKVITIFADEMDQLQSTFDRIEDWDDVNNARGKVLDDMGQNIVQPRGAVTDEIYRILLQSKVARNFSDGAINTIIQVLATALNINPNEIQIKELFNDPETPEPAAIGLIQLPLKRLNEVGMSAKQFVSIVKKTVGSGIRVANVELTGTFSFSSQNNLVEIDNEYGFSDINQKIGGYLGAAFSDADDTNIPV